MSVESALSAVTTSTEASFADAPLAQRPSLARKRRAVLPLVNISSTTSLSSRVPSSLSLSSDISSDSSSDDDSQSQIDIVKRSRHDSAVSIVTVSSDEGDSSSQLSVQSFSSFDSCSCGCGGPSTHLGKKILYLENDVVVGNYRIVGAGREVKAVHMETGEVFDARVLSYNEYETVQRVMDRLDEARLYYRKADIDAMRDSVLPSSVEVVEESSGRFVMFSPIYQKTLHSFAQERGIQISEAEIQPLFEEVLRMLAFCHSVGIIVRDIKPKKLVFASSGKLRLSHVCDCWVLCDPNNDFMQEKCGSPAYVPPEVVASCSSSPSEGRGYSGKAADMWGMGVMLYLLFFGRYPFYDQTPKKVFQKIMQARVVIPSSALISKHARMVLFNLLRKSAEERLTAEELLAIPWTQAPTKPSRGYPERRIFRSDLLSFTADGRSAVSPISPTNGLADEEGSRPPSRSSTPPLEELNLQAIVNSARRLLFAAQNSL